MKRLLYLGVFLFVTQMLPAQNNKQAEELLDNLVASLSGTNGIRIDFTGSENGTLYIKKEKFHLKNDKIQSWYDGKTQWTYVADNEEVNISHPTPEELQSLNPYLILTRYKTDFYYTYKGIQTKNGMNGHEIVLKPKQPERKEIIRIYLSKTNQPLGMKIEQNGQTISEINVINYQTGSKLTDDTFRFDKSQYPDAEIIDLR